MTRLRDRGGRERGRVVVGRIKLVIVGIGAGLSALMASLTGITPQTALAPMLSWMLGFSPTRAQATAMRATAASAIACVLGALWRSGVSVVVAPGVDTRLSQIKVASAIPGEFAMSVISLYVGALIGTLLTTRAVPRPNQIVLRRAFLFVGVCIGVYVAAEGAHYSALNTYHNVIVHSPVAFLVVGVLSGALTQMLGLASGVILVPALFYLSSFSIQQVVLVSLAAIALASLLPAWSYAKCGMGDPEYGMAAMIGGILCGFAGGAMLSSISSRLILLLFALFAMFFSAREISVLAAAQAVTKSASSTDSG